MAQPSTTSVDVGIDVSKSTLDVHVNPTGDCFQVAYDDEGLRHLLKHLLRLHPQRIVLEATGGLEAIVTLKLANAGLPVIVVNPRQIRDFARASGILSKTDKQDAGVIAAFAAKMKPLFRPIADEDQRQFQDLVHRRDQLVKMQANEKKRLHQTNTVRVQQSIRNILDLIQHELHDLDTDIRSRIEASAIWRAKDELFQSVPSVGPQASARLLADFPELGTMNRYQAAALSGTAPMNQDSGTKRGQRHIKHGRKTVRNTLYMCSLSAARVNPVLHAFYQRMIEKNKPAKVALIAVSRKLIVLLNQMARDGRMWEPTLEQNLTTQHSR
jgi:transposase